MAKIGSSDRFPELFELIAAYAKGNRAHQEKALRLINVAYEGPPEVEGMPDARQAVDDILNGNDGVPVAVEPDASILIFLNDRHAVQENCTIAGTGWYMNPVMPG